MKFRLVEDNLIGINDPKVDEVVDELPPEQEEDMEYMIDVLEDKINMTPIADNHKLYKALDRCLKIAKQGIIYDKDSKAAANLLVIGRAGTGKSEIIQDWAKRRNINLISKNASSFDKTDMGGAVAQAVDDTGKTTNTVTRLSNAEFDGLNEPGSVLFLDELNRADSEIMGSLLTLVLDHKVPDTSAKNGMKKLRGFLFTVAAINPADDNYEGTNALDNAMRNRFRRLELNDIDIPGYRQHVIDEWESGVKKAEAEYKRKPSEFTAEAIIEAKGRLGLCKALLSSPLFSFDSLEDETAANENQEPFTSPRSLSAALRNCDGTKADFIDVFPDFCNPNKLDTIEQILTNYVDVQDKANDALKYKDGFLQDEDEEESIFGEESAWDKLQGAL